MRALVLLVCVGSCLAWGEPADSGQPKSLAETDPKTLFEMGYALRETNRPRARELYREVIRRTAPADEVHKKAKARLNEIR